jgi:hypothetical protein
MIAPTILLMIVSGMVSYCIVDTEIGKLRSGHTLADEYLNLPDVAVGALVGAYSFIAWDMIWRAARRDVSPSDILGAIIRILIAIPLGYSLAALFKPDVGPFIAFATGAFPMRTVVTILQRLANKQFGVQIGASASKDQVTELSCVDQSVADRLQDADITTVCQLAYCDPVQTCMRTNLSFAFVSDIMAQALAWIYLGKKLDQLRPIGLRGAVEFSCSLDDLNSDDEVEARHADAMLKKAAGIAKLSTELFRNTVEQIGEDPYTNFLAETWPDWTAEESGASQALVLETNAHLGGGKTSTSPV